ncbi:UNVERIFIED_CONTAM: hypothetical protein RMT77_008413 [Armadillidium vulgare]
MPEGQKLKNRNKHYSSMLKNLLTKQETKICNIPPLKSFDQFFSYGKKVKAKCEKKVTIGGSGKYGNDGVKYVCLDDRFKFEPGNCTVLSFGINNEWSFDDAISKLGCTVYAFDPTMNKGDFDRSSQIHFFSIGLSRANKIGVVGEVNRYKTILKKLKLTNKQIDYLKMDIEKSEVDFFEDVFSTSPQLLKNIKQIGMEIHPGRAIEEGDELLMNGTSMFNFLWNGIHKLECHGFELFDYRMNPANINHYTFKNRVESACYEVVWIKTSVNHYRFRE